MSLIKQKMPLLARHEGTWEGTYTFITPELEILDRYDFTIRVSFPEDGRGGLTYRQESAYRWPDGRTQALAFEGIYEDRAVIFDTPRIAGRLWELDQRTLYLTFKFPAQAGVDVCEMIQLGENGRDRARTWHWFRNERLFQLTLVKEQRAPR